MNTPKKPGVTIDNQEAFDSAIYYSTDPDAERLYHEDPDEALQEYFETCNLCDIEDGVAVLAYKREEVHPTHLEQMGASVAETFFEQFCDEYGDPEGDHEDIPDAVREIFVAAVKDARKHLTVWRCKKVATQTWDGPSLERHLRKEMPEIFEDAGI